MKFIKLESRGGNYLVVASNIAWLRTAENGQTNVGMIGGQPLLVVGSIEEVAAKILSSFGPEDRQDYASQPPADAAPAPAAAVSAQPEPVAAEPEPEPEPEPVMAAPEPELEPEPVPQPPAQPLAAPVTHVEQMPEEASVPIPPSPAPRPRPRAMPQRGLPLAERLALAESAKITAGTQRMMRAHD